MAIPVYNPSIFQEPWVDSWITNARQLNNEEANSEENGPNEDWSLSAAIQNTNETQEMFIIMLRIKVVELQNRKMRSWKLNSKIFVRGHENLGAIVG